MAITITFDTVAESAAFFGLMAGRNINVEQIGSTMAASITGASQAAPAGATEPDKAAGSAVLDKPVAAPAAAPAPAPAPAATDGDKKPSAAQEAVAAATAAAKAGAKAVKEKTSPKAAPAAKPEPTADTPPTATAETVVDASAESGGDFFGSTSQTADATAADQAEIVEPTYTYQQVHDGLREWSGKVDRDTFAALMQECEVKSVPALEDKPELYATIMKKIAAK